MIQVWHDGMVQAASCPNVVLKVGGIGMEHYFGTAWAALDAPPGSEEVAAYWSDQVHFAIETFSPSRCMFESNFPVDRQTLPYTVLWNGFQILGDRYSAAGTGRSLFWHGGSRLSHRPLAAHGLCALHRDATHDTALVGDVVGQQSMQRGAVVPDHKIARLPPVFVDHIVHRELGFDFG